MLKRNKELFVNIAQLVDEQAMLNPDNPSSVMPKKKLFGGFSYSQLTFRELEKRIETYSFFLEKQGFRPGDRTLLFIRPCLEFHALVFALFRSGIIPVLIDPGMGKENLLRAIEKTKPRGLIAESVVFWLRRFYPKSFSSVRIHVKKSDIKSWNIEKKNISNF